MHCFRLACRLLRRDWRSAELSILSATLIVAMAAVLTISLSAQRLLAGMAQESAELLGGDLVIESSRPPKVEWAALGPSLGLQTTTTYHFDSAIIHGDKLVLASVKAVEVGYPLIGTLKVRPSLEANLETKTEGPTPGTAWVARGLLERMDIQIGDEVQFGAIRLRIVALLASEPDQGANAFSWAPRMLINAADLRPAQVLGPGSRISYRTLFHGDSIDRIQAQLGADLGPGYRLLTPRKGQGRANTALFKASQYLQIAIVLAIVLAATSIALSIRRYGERHYDVCAMLRCLGAPQLAIVRIYSYQLLLLTCLAAAIAYPLGWFAHEIILHLLGPMVGGELPGAGSTPWWITSGCGVLLMVGFALPPVLSLAETPALRVLHRELGPMKLSAWLTYGAAGVSMGLLVWLLFDDVLNVLATLSIAIGGVIAIGTLLYLGLRRLGNTGRFQRLFIARGLRNLSAHAATSSCQITAFAIALMVVLVMVQIRGQLLEEWRLQLPKEAPNHFAYNLFEDEVPRFLAMASTKTELEPLYPIVRGRLVAINDNPLKSGASGDIDRELNLTWATVLPNANTVLGGVWPPQSEGVSIEDGFAQRLGLELGDRLEFNVAGERVHAEITSMRSVVWESLSPNFYLIFSNRQLADLPTTYLTSFYLKPEDKPFLRELIATFPALSLIEVDSILERMQSILERISLIVEFVVIFIFLSGVGVLFATLQNSMDERLTEGALMRSLGASRSFLMRATVVEFALLGLIAGMIAVFGAEITSALIFHYVFHLSYRPEPLLWIAAPILVALVIATLGHFGSRKIAKVSPLILLNR